MNIEIELLELRKNMGMNRRQFAEYFGIPYRTVQDWELGNRKMPEYLLRLIEYKAKVEIDEIGLTIKEHDLILPCGMTGRVEFYE